jgi:hypothetical protein
MRDNTHSGLVRSLAYCLRTCTAFETRRPIDQPTMLEPSNWIKLDDKHCATHHEICIRFGLRGRLLTAIASGPLFMKPKMRYTRKRRIIVILKAHETSRPIYSARMCKYTY